MPVRACLLLAALLMGAPTAGSAQESARAVPAVRAKNLLQGSLGVGSPVGALGISYTYLPIRQIEIEMGGGIGFTGYQVSAMPKLSLGDHDRLVLGLGPSLSIDASDQSQQSYVGYWLNGEIGYRHSTAAGLSVLAAVGVGYGLGGSVHALCPGDCDSRAASESAAGRWVPEARVAVGRAF
jgi:hypothetical protein